MVFTYIIFFFLGITDSQETLMDEKACKIFYFNDTQELEPITTLEITAKAENCVVTKPFIQTFLVEKSSVSKALIDLLIGMGH